MVLMKGYKRTFLMKGYLLSNANYLNSERPQFLRSLYLRHSLMIVQTIRNKKKSLEIPVKSILMVRIGKHFALFYNCTNKQSLLLVS